MKGDSNKKWLVGLGVVIVGIIILFALAKFFVPTSGTPVYAPQGQVVSGFPQSLILDSQAAIAQSYSIGYSSSTNQYTALWVSTASPRSLAIGYSVYFSTNKWKVINQSTSSPSLQSIYAIDMAGNSVNFTAVAKGTGSQVSVSYLHQ